MTTSDIERIIESDEIQSVLRPKLATVPLPKGRSEEVVSAVDEWAAAFKKLDEIRTEEKNRKQSPKPSKLYLMKLSRTFQNHQRISPSKSLIITSRNRNKFSLYFIYFGFYFIFLTFSNFHF